VTSTHETRRTSFDAVVDTDGVARASRHTLLAQIATQVSRLAVSVILARLLTPQEFGVAAAAMIVMVVAWQLTDLGTAAVIIQRDVVDEALVSSVFWFNLAFGASLSALAFVGAQPIADALGQPHAAPAIRVLAAVSVIGAIGNMHHALLRRTMQFGRLATITIANAAVNSLVGIGLALMGAGVWALVIGTLSGVAVSSAAAWWFERWRPTAVFSVSRLREVARFSIQFFWSNTLGSVFDQLDKVIISRMLGGAPLGTYAVAQRTVLSPVQALSGAVSTVTFSAFSRGQDDPERLRAGATRASGVVALVALPTMIGLAVLAEPAVLVVYGDQWEAAIPVIQVLAPVAALNAVTSVTSSVMLGMGRSDWLYRWGLAYCLVGPAAMAVGARWGLVGVSLALAATVVVLRPFEVRMALGLIDMRLSTYVRALLPHVVITAVMGIVAWSVAHGVGQAGGGSLEQLLAGTVAGVVAHLGLMWPCRVPAMDDARRVLGRWAVRK
jgi:O-antigen/teichoic acid export membrane protein